MKHRNMMFIICAIAIPFSLLSMEIKKEDIDIDIELEEDNHRYEGIPVSYLADSTSTSLHNQVILRPENHHDNEWEYQWCPTPYYANECSCEYCWNGSCTRGCTSTVSGGIAALCGLIKLVSWCDFNSGEICAQACSTNQCTPVWFPTTCSHVSEVACSTLRWGCSLGFIGGSITTLGAWSPCWDARGCILRKRMRVNQLRQNNN